MGYFAIIYLFYYGFIYISEIAKKIVSAENHRDIYRINIKPYHDITCLPQLWPVNIIMSIG